MQKDLSAPKHLAELPQGPKVEALPAAAEKTAGSIREGAKKVIHPEKQSQNETMGLEEAVMLLDLVYTKSEARMVMAECARRGLIQTKATPRGILYTPADNPLVKKFVSLIHSLPEKPETAKRKDLPAAKNRRAA